MKLYTIDHMKSRLLIELLPGEHLTIRTLKPNQPLTISHDGILHNTSTIHVGVPGDGPDEYPNPAP